MIQDLTLAVSKIQKPEPSQPRPPLDVECPVCMEVARPPMRLRQCGMGHIVTVVMQEERRMQVQQEEEIETLVLTSAIHAGRRSLADLLLWRRFLDSVKQFVNKLDEI